MLLAEDNPANQLVAEMLLRKLGCQVDLARNGREAIESLVVMMSPFAPHTAEELWERYGHEGGLQAAAWPRYDAAVARAEEVVIPVQVNGKVRSRIAAAPDASDAELERLALTDAAVQPYVKDREVTKVVVARGRLVSIVVR